MSNIKINKTNDLQGINRIQSDNVKRTDKSGAQAVEVSNVTSEDKIDFSSAAVEAGKLVEQLKNLPDVREEKVAALRDQISAGEYDPSDEDIADAILKDES